MKKTLIFALIFLISLSLVNAVETAISYEELRFDLVRTDPSPLSAGGSFDIWFDITNLQSYTIRNVQISLVDKFPFNIKNTDERAVLISEIKPGEKRSVKYSVNINKDINEGTYQLGMQYYSDKLEATVSKNFNLDVKTTSVVVGATNVRLIPERVKPGEVANLEVDILNAASSSINDISAELGLGGTAFVTLGETSEKKIRQLAPNAKVTLNYKLIVNPEAESKVYTIPLSITYYDQLGGKYTRNNTIGIPVYAKPEYNLDLEDTEVFINGQAGEVTISLANKGNSELKFLSIELLKSKDYNIISNPRIYIGNLESDDFETATYKIQAKSSKPVSLKLNIEYKDSYNADFKDNVNVELPLYYKFTAQNLGLVKRNTFLLNLIVSILIFLLAYKTYKIWKHERDLEKSVKIVYKDIKTWIRENILRRKR